jgi:methylated-DNA-[protein]-cysteine S-methyltransferase
VVEGDDEFVRHIYVPSGGLRATTTSANAVSQCVTQLEEYFAGTRRSFSVSLAPAGTAFQNDVWRALHDIPYGDTRTYADIAEAIGRPLAMRAVGNANGANPYAIVVPCHRVVARGGLGGYGGGLACKIGLLELEGAVLP